MADGPSEGGDLRSRDTRRAWKQGTGSPSRARLDQGQASLREAREERAQARKEAVPGRVSRASAPQCGDPAPREADISVQVWRACRAHGQLCVSVSAGDGTGTGTGTRTGDETEARPNAGGGERRRGRSRDIGTGPLAVRPEPQERVRVPATPLACLPAAPRLFMLPLLPRVSPARSCTSSGGESQEREHRRRDSLLDLDARSEVRPGFLILGGPSSSVLEVPFFLGRLSCLPPGSPPGLGRESPGVASGRSDCCCFLAFANGSQHSCPLGVTCPMHRVEGEGTQVLEPGRAESAA